MCFKICSAVGFGLELKSDLGRLLNCFSCEGCWLVTTVLFQVLLSMWRHLVPIQTKLATPHTHRLQNRIDVMGFLYSIKSDSVCVCFAGDVLIQISENQRRLTSELEGVVCYLLSLSYALVNHLSISSAYVSLLTLNNV